MGVVLEAQGLPTYRPHNGTASKRYPLKMLSSLAEGDTVFLPPASKLTLSQLSTGTRFQLTGPLELTLGPGGIQAGPGVAALAAPAQRQGIIAGKDVDLSKLGGVTSRYAGTPVFVQEPTPDLDVDLVPDRFETSTLQVRCRIANSQSAWTAVNGTWVHRANRQDRLRLPGMRFDENKAYVIYWGDKPDPKDDDAQFTVIRIPEEKLKGVRELDRSAKGLVERLEVVAAYQNLRLFGRAEEILLEIQQQYPTEASWSHVWEEFNQQRRHKMKI